MGLISRVSSRTYRQNLKTQTTQKSSTMISRIARIASRNAGNVAVLGANGGIGQPLSLLMKQNTQVKQLNLFDIVGTPGVAADLSHCDTSPAVAGFQGPDQLADCLTGMDVVIIPAGVPRKPGMTRDDLFNTTVPIACEVYNKLGVAQDKIFGVTTLNIVRSQAFVAEKNGADVATQHVPVIGGHAGITIIPVLSQASPALSLPQSEIVALTERIQDAGTEVVKAKDGAGSATLSMAFAAARFADNLLTAQAGNEVTEYAYIASDVTESTYFSSKLTLNASGVAQNHGLGDLNDYEKELVAAAVPELMKTVTKGENFTANYFANK